MISTRKYRIRYSDGLYNFGKGFPCQKIEATVYDTFDAANNALAELVDGVIEEFFVDANGLEAIEHNDPMISIKQLMSVVRDSMVFCTSTREMTINPMVFLAKLEQLLPGES